MSNISPGLYPTPPASSPDDPPRLHQSLAHTIVSRSPLHAWHEAFGPHEEKAAATGAQLLGEISHSLLLGGKSIVRVEADNFLTKAAKETKAAALAEGKLPCIAAKLDEAAKLTESLRDVLKNRYGIETLGDSEITAIWWSPGGVWCQGRMDHLIKTGKNARILDFKFGRSAQPEAIGRSMVDYGADIQQAAYTEAIEELFPELAGRVEFLFPYIETEPPNAITVCRQSGMMRSLGLSRWIRAKEIWAECLEKYGTATPWPSYRTEIVDIEPPAWMMSKDTEEWLVRERAE